MSEDEIVSVQLAQDGIFQHDPVACAGLDDDIRSGLPGRRHHLCKAGHGGQPAEVDLFQIVIRIEIGDDIDAVTIRKDEGVGIEIAG
ncbi:hypothetical protein FNJ84_21145 [Paracoccus sp. M683]|nr:hypothetical protein FNJ84_21145 [Paracoccus sp. M683]